MNRRMTPEESERLEILQSSETPEESERVDYWVRMVPQGANGQFPPIKLVCCSDCHPQVDTNGEESLCFHCLFLRWERLKFANGVLTTANAALCDALEALSVEMPSARNAAAAPDSEGCGAQGDERCHTCGGLDEVCSKCGGPDDGKASCPKCGNLEINTDCPCASCHKRVEP